MELIFILFNSFWEDVLSAKMIEPFAVSLDKLSFNNFGRILHCNHLDSASFVHTYTLLVKCINMIHFLIISPSLLPIMASSYSPIFFFLLSLSYAATFTFASRDVVVIDGLKYSKVYNLPSAAGPESFTFDCKGEGPYTGVSDGRIFKYEGYKKGWVEFAVTTPNRQDAPQL